MRTSTLCTACEDQRRRALAAWARQVIAWVNAAARQSDATIPEPVRLSTLMAHRVARGTSAPAPGGDELAPVPPLLSERIRAAAGARR
jgi:hypothetical protein